MLEDLEGAYWLTQNESILRIVSSIAREESCFRLVCLIHRNYSYAQYVHISIFKIQANRTKKVVQGEARNTCTYAVDCHGFYLHIVNPPPKKSHSIGKDTIHRKMKNEESKQFNYLVKIFFIVNLNTAKV